MRISKSNNLFDATFGVDYTVSAGGFVNGQGQDLVNPDFSYFPTISGTTVSIFVGATSSEFPSNYFALHGVRFNAGPNSSIKAQVSSDGAVVGTYDVTRQTSLFFTRAESNTSWQVSFFTDGGFAVVVSVSYIATGLYSEFPRSGVRGGEYMPFFGNNRVVTSTSNQLAQPIARVVKSVAKQVVLRCPNAGFDYAETELQEILAKYNEDTLLSVQMFNDKPLQSFVGFDLIDSVNVNGDSGEELVAVSLTMKASL